MGCCRHGHCSNVAEKALSLAAPKAICRYPEVQRHLPQPAAKMQTAGR